MSTGRFLTPLLVALVVVSLDVSTALAAGVRVVTVSGLSPFPADCGIAGQPGTLYLNSEVEPRVAVDPTNSQHIVGTWQQDRWSNGGARGIGVGVSFVGGRNWTRVAVPGVLLCRGAATDRVK